MQAIQTFPVYRKFLLSLLRHLYHLTHFFLQLGLNKFLMYAKVLDVKISNVNEAAKPIKFHFFFFGASTVQFESHFKKKNLRKVRLDQASCFRKFPSEIMQKNFINCF